MAYMVLLIGGDNKKEQSDKVRQCGLLTFTLI